MIRVIPVSMALLLLSAIYINGLHLSISIYSRTLIPSYLFQTSVLAWECSLCSKLFCLTADEAAERVHLESPPAYIEREFRLHSCVVVLFAKQEKHDAEVFRIASNVIKLDRSRNSGGG